eukprot:361814-Chlamydomonas_euryale.AAC.9
MPPLAQLQADRPAQAHTPKLVCQQGVSAYTPLGERSLARQLSIGCRATCHTRGPHGAGPTPGFCWSISECPYFWTGPFRWGPSCAHVVSDMPTRQVPVLPAMFFARGRMTIAPTPASRCP